MTRTTKKFINYSKESRFRYHCTSGKGIKYTWTKDFSDKVSYDIGARPYTKIQMFEKGVDGQKALEVNAEFRCKRKVEKEPLMSPKWFDPEVKREFYTLDKSPQVIIKEIMRPLRGLRKVSDQALARFVPRITEIDNRFHGKILWHGKANFVKKNPHGVLYDREFQLSSIYFDSPRSINFPVRIARGQVFDQIKTAAKSTSTVMNTVTGVVNTFKVEDINSAASKVSDMADKVKGSATVIETEVKKVTSSISDTLKTAKSIFSTTSGLKSKLVTSMLPMVLGKLMKSGVIISLFSEKDYKRAIILIVAEVVEHLGPVLGSKFQEAWDSKEVGQDPPSIEINPIKNQKDSSTQMEKFPLTRMNLGNTEVIDEKEDRKRREAKANATGSPKKTKVGKGQSLDVFEALRRLATLVAGFMVELKMPLKSRVRECISLLVNCTKLERGISSGIKIFEMFVKFLRKAFNYFITQLDPAFKSYTLLKSYGQELSEWIAEVTVLTSEDSTERLYYDKKWLEKATAVIDKGDVYLRKFSDDIKVAAAIRLVMRDFKKLIDDRNRAQGQKEWKFDPFCVCLSGPPNCGKSVLTKSIVRDLANAVGAPETNRSYARNASDKFWSRYTGNFAVIYDDFFQISQGTNAETAVAEFFSIKSSAPTQLNMAEVQDKGRSFTSKLLVLTANSSHPTPTFITSQEAFWRRRDILIKCEARPGFTMADGRLDPAKLHASEKNDHMLFALGNPNDPRGFDALQCNRTYEDIIQQIISDFKDHYDNQMHILGQDVKRSEGQVGGQLRLPSLMTPDDCINPNYNQDYLCTLFEFDLFGQFRMRMNLTASQKQSCLDLLAMNDFVVIDQAFRKRIAFYKEGYSDELTIAEDENEFLEILENGKYFNYFDVNQLKAIRNFMQFKIHKGIPPRITISHSRFSDICRIAKYQAKQAMSKAKLLFARIPYLKFFLFAGAATISAVIAFVAYWGTKGDGQISSGDYYTRKANTYHSVRPPPRVPRQGRPEGDPNAMDLINGMVRKQLYKMTADDGQRCQSMLALNIGDRYMLTLNHFFMDLQANQEIDFTNATTGVTIIESYDPENLQEIDEDVVLYKCSARMPMGKSVWKHFVREDDLTHLGRTRAILAKMEGYGMCLKCVTAKPLDYLYDNYYVVAGKAFSVREGFSYECCTEQGDCGAPLIADNTKMPNKIIGVHCSAYNSSESWSRLVTYELLEQYMVNTCSVVDLKCAEGEMKIVPPGNYTRLGLVPPHLRVHIPSSSKIIPSKVFEEFTPHVSEPSVLSKFDHRCSNQEDPLTKGVSKYGSTRAPFRQDVVKVVIDQMKTEYLKIRSDIRVDIFEPDVAINNFNCKGLERMDILTSPGLPYIRERLKKGKQDWINQDGSGNLIITGPLLKKRVKDRIDMAMVGINADSLWCDMLKDERVSLEKVALGKTRIFTVPPMDFTVVSRMVFNSFVQGFVVSRNKIASAVGINPYSKEWDALYNTLRAFGENRSFDGDYSAFDGTLEPVFMDAFAEVVNHWYNIQGSHSKQIDVFGERVMIDGNRLRNLLVNEMIHTLQVAREECYRTHQGNCSGNPLTVVINSFVNECYIRYAYEVLCEERIRFEEAIRMKVYGDDIIVCVHPSVNSFNPEALQALLAYHGIKLGNAHKDGSSMGYINLGSCIFLKNSFRWDSRLKRWLAALDMNTCLEMVNWIRSGGDEWESTRENMDAAMRFIWSHGKDSFFAWEAKFNKTLIQYQQECLQENWSTCLARYRSA